MLETKLEGAEPAPDLELNVETRDDLVAKRTVLRTKKISAPDAVRPTGRYTSCRDALKAFDSARESTIAYAKSSPPFLRGRFLRHQVGGLLDGYQWLILLAAHTERHIGQIEEAKQTLHVV
jgi:hypothetical protein